MTATRIAIDVGTGPRSIGLDIGGTSSRAAVLDGDYNVVAFVSLPTERTRSGVVRTAVSAIMTLTDGAGLDQMMIDRIGVGIPGAVDPRSGEVRHAVNLGIGSECLALASALSDRFDCPVHVENDVKAAAVGAEFHLASSRGRSADLAYLSVGTGIAAGFVENGILRRGSSLVAGEIGHIPIDPNGPRCACGQVGCIEAIASGSVIERLWPSTTGSAASALSAAAATGDVDAVQGWRAVIAGLSRAVLLLTLTMDPELIVLGGGVAELGDSLRDAIVAHLADEQQHSEFLRSLDVGARIRMIDPSIPLGSIGAVRAARLGASAAAV